MPDFLIDLLKRNRSPEPKQPLDALQDSASEMTLIEKAKARPCHVKNKNRTTNTHFNPADLCFGSCCRN
ncbi:hypothetical protein BDV34DRAFT_179905 [Aspergillus parasiticus]|uniref:Uncharacterized protein n=5 Tax=Aspergillus subgen. Circumdati TaxID=2720871 RepID=A0A5N6D9T3_ASPPA|nr:hypothetical protein BDV34DRAFT_179905 [Aspergillus parasiticus]KAB8220837.1 hypothetical protein BDV33DRAFT_86536 [Aspergillus novoparasiticus]KAE8317503.1 hypothetical protein BDV41DRAFT_12597 [Aspergillus transmontanensis]KAE8325758.1 hypothetical protein BDV39DRAFT_101114 [Aspergillus sergii]KAE8341726.1 hypothetical protein BDV24DRAFT_163269 [Aspergillus arachidicola]